MTSQLGLARRNLALLDWRRLVVSTPAGQVIQASGQVCSSTKLEMHSKLNSRIRWRAQDGSEWAYGIPKGGRRAASHRCQPHSRVANAVRGSAPSGR